MNENNFDPEPLLADWECYKQILFNIFQNSAKYNTLNGAIMILLSLQYDLFNQEHFLTTEVIDTGIGISCDRQKMLFKPFRELSIKQNFKKVKDKSCGLGLACSKDISKKLGGDTLINFSRPGLTSFMFRIPVKRVDKSRLPP